MESFNTEQVNKLIKEYEEKFQKALTNSEEPSLLSSLKKNLDYFKDLRTKDFLDSTRAA